MARGKKIGHAPSQKVAAFTDDEIAALALAAGASQFETLHKGSFDLLLQGYCDNQVREVLVATANEVGRALEMIKDWANNLDRNLASWLRHQLPDADGSTTKLMEIAGRPHRTRKPISRSASSLADDSVTVAIRLLQNRENFVRRGRKMVEVGSVFVELRGALQRLTLAAHEIAEELPLEERTTGRPSQDQAYAIEIAAIRELAGLMADVGVRPRLPSDGHANAAFETPGLVLASRRFLDLARGRLIDLAASGGTGAREAATRAARVCELGPHALTRLCRQAARNRKPPPKTS